MAASPDDRRYSNEHEWVLMRGDVAVIGITDYAQDQLGDIVYVGVPETGTKLTQFEKMGEIESVKAVSELYSPISGEVLRANDALREKPELVNSEPHEGGWLIEVTPADAGELGKLMSAQEYDDFTANEQRDEAIGP